MKNRLSLGATLHQLNSLMDKHSELMLQQKFKIGYSQFKILSALLWRENVRQREIADFLDQTEASISRQIGILVDAGLVFNLRDVQNKRQHIISLTGRGTEVAKQALGALENLHAPMFQLLSTTQQEELKAILDTMYAYVATQEAR